MFAAASVYFYQQKTYLATDASTVDNLILPGGARYSGDLKQGLIHGKGHLEWPDGRRYEGDFENWQFHGLGTFTDSKGTYIGEFKRGYYEGRGEYRYSEDDRVESGYWRWGKYEGSKPANRKSQARAIESAIYQQNILLQQAEEQLAQGNPEAIDLYFVGVGGYSRQDVFRKEVTFIRARMDEQFTTAGRSLVLMNHLDTLTEFPLATTHSLEQSLQAVARKMDSEQDILMVYLTSHGSEQHEFSLVQQGLSLPDLSAKRLGEIIHALPIKWKIVIVSACYSGGFIPALESPTTLVMSAAREDRKSFGCSDDSEMTYFGRAFFEQALPQASSFEEAFALSDTLITQWEKDLSEEVEHSYPQMVMGEEIKNWLPRWWQSLPPRASVVEQGEPQSVK